LSRNGFLRNKFVAELALVTVLTTSLCKERTRFLRNKFVAKLALVTLVTTSLCKERTWFRFRFLVNEWAI
jgi:hypothetical protein